MEAILCLDVGTMKSEERSRGPCSRGLKLRSFAQDRTPGTCCACDLGTSASESLKAGRVQKKRSHPTGHHHGLTEEAKMVERPNCCRPEARNDGACLSVLNRMLH